MKAVFVTGSFDDLRSKQVRFLEEAARFGPLHVMLWSDAMQQALHGAGPKFPQAERQYFLEAIRFVQQVTVIDEPRWADCLPPGLVSAGSTWAVTAETGSPARAAYCQANGIDYCIITDEQLQNFSMRGLDPGEPAGDRKKVVVTGCYDWLHTGHVRFFEEAAQLGDLFVVIGSDANVHLLKGEGHPLFREAERLYMVQAIRYVYSAMVSSGSGWMDAEPEIGQIRPDRYAVNEDGDKPEKRAFCQEHGLDYVVLKRMPKEGLPRRESTQLRGF